MEFFDSHAHIDDDRFNEDREDIINEIFQSGVTRFISAGYSMEGSLKAVEYAKKYKNIYSSCGISPNDIPQSEEELWNYLNKIEDLVIETRKNINEKIIVAIGEIGLDYYWEKDEKMRQLQKKAFIYQIDLANKLDLPIIIHTRDAVMDTLEILKNHSVKNRGIFHCCPQNRELIKEGLKLGFYISFAGPITFKSSKNADEMINLVPDDRILIETDSPYLAPEPVRGTRNTPINLKFVAQKIADAKGKTLEEVAEMTMNNANKIYGI